MEQYERERFTRPKLGFAIRRVNHAATSRDIVEFRNIPPVFGFQRFEMRTKLPSEAEMGIAYQQAIAVTFISSRNTAWGSLT